MQRLKLIVVVVALAVAVPIAAVEGAPPNPLKVAKKALKKAKSAKRIAKRHTHTFEIGQITGVEATAIIPAGDVGSVTAFCPAGQRVMSGGNVFIAAEGEIFFEQAGSGRIGWSVGGDNFDSPLSGELTAIAYCAPANVPVAGRPQARAATQDQADAAVARQRALYER